MIRAIEHAASFGGDQAIAGPRGEGKTKYAIFVSFKLVLIGAVLFPVIVSKSGKVAERELSNLKNELLYNDRLAEDYPEVCAPIRALEGSASRARLQTFGGEYTRIDWKQEYIILPTVAGSVASGRIIASVGIEGAIRGMNFRNVRPDLCIIDDVDDRESAKSDLQTETRCRTIDEDIAGLGGQGKRVSRVMLCTLLNTTCTAARFTDRTQYPSFKGRRFAMVKTWPERMDLWEQYIKLRQDRNAEQDPDARIAHEFYRDNFDSMNAAAVVSNENRKVSAPLSDGEPAELTGLQHAFNWIADIGRDAFDTEYQNDPPQESGPQDNGITAAVVRSRVNGLDQRVLPDTAQYLTRFIDLGARWLHWGSVAWSPGAIGAVVDYGMDQVVQGDRMAREEAILIALRDRREAWAESECCVTSHGEVRPADMTLVDAGNWQGTAYKFCEESGDNWHPSMGLSKYRNRTRSKTIRPGDNWYWSKQPNGGPWVMDMNHDHWVEWLHERFLTEPLDDAGQPNRGSMTLFGRSQSYHSDFARHMVSEVFRVEFIEGKGERRTCYKSGPNHWLDVMYGNCVAASALGVRLLPTAPKPQRRGRSRPWISNPTGRAFLASQR